MDATSAVILDDEGIEALLGTGGTGVISLAAGENPPVTRPVSYGFDSENRRFYFRLAAGPDSEKEPFVDGGAASFVTYDHGEDGWESVVATGTLHRVENESAVDTELLEGFRRVDIPLYDVFSRDTREVTFEFVYLDPDSLTGRQEHAPTE